MEMRFAELFAVVELPDDMTVMLSANESLVRIQLNGESAWQNAVLKMITNAAMYLMVVAGLPFHYLLFINFDPQSGTAGNINFSIANYTRGCFRTSAFRNCGPLSAAGFLSP